MLTAAALITGTAVYFWQRKPANRALACRAGASAAGWLEGRLSAIAGRSEDPAPLLRPDSHTEPGAIEEWAPFRAPSAADECSRDAARFWLSLYR